jgi:hypothetical protein
MYNYIEGKTLTKNGTILAGLAKIFFAILKVNKTAHYEIDYISLFVTCTDVCGSSFTPFFV